MIKLLQDKIRMAKAKLIQVTTGNVIGDIQHNKSLLVGGSKPVDHVGQTTEVATYELYHQSKTKSLSNNNGYEDTHSASGQSNHQQQQQQQLHQGRNGSVGTGHNPMDSGFDVDSSTCTATTTSKTNLIIYIIKFLILIFE